MMLRALFTISVCLIGGIMASGKPNIIVILADDVGYNDVQFSSRPSSEIKTPEIRSMCDQGVVFDNYYTSSTCTPSRASLQTGRYAANTGLNFPLLPGAIGGLPKSMVTMPQFLRKHANYEAHMVGKWHVGSAQHSQTPVGRGYQTHVGSLLWSMDYNTKVIYEMPWDPPILIDWIRANETHYEHYQEPRHSTEAITQESVDIINRHAERHEDKPLFLYVAYTAAHAPLLPLEQDIENCAHFPHEWRRKFCGLVVGLDRGIGKIKKEALEKLGENTIILFSSDNGGATWFGGNNFPLRSGKTTPFEGGVKVPACWVDFSGNYLGKHQGELVSEIVHISDVFPTVAGAAGIAAEKITGLKLDGFDLGPSLKSNDVSHPRQSVLLEMYYGSLGEFMFEEDTVACRKGQYKLIESDAHRDTLWYSDSTIDRINNTDSSYTTVIFEKIVRFFERVTSETQFDTVKDLMVHLVIQHLYRTVSTTEKTLLFDLESDPGEKVNIATELPHVVEELRAELEVIKVGRPPQEKFWMTIDRDKEIATALKPGKCLSATPSSQCRFTHYWIDDDADISKIELVDGTAAWPFVRSALVFFGPYLVGLVVLNALCLRVCCGSGREKKSKVA